MKITCISASPRIGSQSKHVATYLTHVLEQINPEVAVSVIDLAEVQLPIYDDGVANKQLPNWQPVSTELAASDGFIFVSPEWDGMFSVALHNMLHYAKHELADKPVYLVAVSSGRGGRYPLLQMRTMGYKNKRFVSIPESLFIDHVKDNLVNGDMENEFIATRARYGLEILLAYAAALNDVRASGVLNYEEFGNGW